MQLKTKMFSELVAVCIFCFLLGITLFLILMSKDVNSIKEYVEVMSFQLSTISISKARVFLYVLFNRIVLFSILFVVSILVKSKYISHMFLGSTFILYGIYVSVNIALFGFRGIVSGFVLIVPQWFLYMMSYMKLISVNKHVKGVLTVSNILRVAICILGVVVGVIIESYVTLPLFFKIFFK